MSRFPVDDAEDGAPREVCVAVLGYQDDIERVRVFSNETLASVATGVIGRNTGYGWHLFPADFEESVRVEVTSEIASGADK